MKVVAIGKEHSFSMLHANILTVAAEMYIVVMSG